MLDGQCLVHKGAKHTMRECMGLAKALLDEQNKKRDDHNDDTGKDCEPLMDASGAFQEPNMTVHTIFGGRAATKNRRDQKLIGWRVLAVKATSTITGPRYLPWSDQPITFTMSDQWAEIPYSGCFLLVLDTILKKVRFKKVLNDGGVPSIFSSPAP